MGEVRLEMAEEAGAQVVVTACPFCLINLEDAIKTTGREGELEVSTWPRSSRSVS